MLVLEWYLEVDVVGFQKKTRSEIMLAYPIEQSQAIHQKESRRITHTLFLKLVIASGFITQQELFSQKLAFNDLRSERCWEKGSWFVHLIHFDLQKCIIQPKIPFFFFPKKQQLPDPGYLNPPQQGSLNNKYEIKQRHGQFISQYILTAS